MGRCAKEAIGRHQTVQRLVRTLKIVVREVMLEPALCVDEVREHSAAEKLVPKRFPEPLDLAEGLRMLWSAADVLDPVSLKRLLELGTAAPHGVLPTVVRQHLLRLTVRCEPSFECLHDQRRLLVVRDRVANDEATVVVHEDAQVQTLLPTLQKRKDVRLPELVRRSTLESPRWMITRCHRRRRRDESLLVKNPPDFVLANAECFEAREYVTNSARPPLRMFILQRHNALARQG